MEGVHRGIWPCTAAPRPRRCRSPRKRAACFGAPLCLSVCADLLHYKNAVASRLGLGLLVCFTVACLALELGSDAAANECLSQVREVL